LAMILLEPTRHIMSQKKITPDVVKKIENALEERKPTKGDRRQSASTTAAPSSERRAGKDRRGPQ